MYAFFDGMYWNREKVPCDGGFVGTTVFVEAGGRVVGQCGEPLHERVQVLGLLFLPGVGVERMAYQIEIDRNMDFLRRAIETADLGRLRRFCYSLSARARRAA